MVQMAYSDQAKAMRRCSALTKDGPPCQQFAVWGDEQGRCATHGGRVQKSHKREKTHYHPCACVAYPFPHRPGSGLCEWPNPPQFMLRMRPGTHSGGTDARKEMRKMTNQPTVLFFDRLYGTRRHGR